MKRLLLTLLIFLPFFCYCQDTTKIAKSLLNRANAEAPGISAKEAIKHIGSEVYVCDTVFDYKIKGRSYIILYVGNEDNSKALEIIIKEFKAKINPQDWKNSLGHFSGRIIIYKGKPTIFVTEPYQLGTRIEI